MSRGARLRVCAPGLALGALLALAGCAGVPPYAPPAPGGAAAKPAAGGTPVARPAAATPAPAAMDTTPSRDALDVLATIPEPLSPGERVPPPATGPGDSAAEAEADTGSADVPVPAPTPVLGQRPLPEIVAPTDTAAPPATAPPPALVSPAPSPAPGAAADTCWRVQIAAPAMREKAERYLEAGRSQLLVALRIESERGLYKVRTGDCMSASAADALRRRAVETGFGGAFRFRGKRP